MGRCQVGEPVEIVLIVYLHALAETGARVTRGDQADQHTIDVHLIAIGRSSTAHPPAVGEAGVDGSIEREDVTREAILNRDRPAQVYGVDDVHSGPLEFGHGSI